MRTYLFFSPLALALPLLAAGQTPPNGPGTPATAPPALAGTPATPTMVPPPLLAPTRTDTSLIAVRDKLDLQATQIPAWQSFEAAVDSYIALYYQEHPVVSAQTDAAPLQFRRLVDQHANRLAALEDIESSVKALYAALSAAQQALANQFLLDTVAQIGNAAAEGPASHDKSSRSEAPAHAGHRPGGGFGSGMGAGMGH